MKIERFEDIESWKAARELTTQIYELSGKGHFAKDFGLKDQIQRASVSVMSSIAEGFDAGTKMAFINFLSRRHRNEANINSLLLGESSISISVRSKLFALRCPRSQQYFKARI